MTEKENKIPDREPDFYLPLFPKYFLKGWKVEQKEGFDLVCKLDLNNGDECVYAERITPNVKLADKFFESRFQDIRQAILQTIVKQYAIELGEPKDYSEKLLKFLSN